MRFTILGLTLNPEELIKQFGTFGLFAIVFAESGLMFGFFLPGDSLLFTAGLLSFKGTLASVPLVWVGCFVAAVAGDQVGYWIGHHAGPRIFNRPDSRLFKHEFVEKAPRAPTTNFFAPERQPDLRRGSPRRVFIA